MNISKVQYDYLLFKLILFSTSLVQKLPKVLIARPVVDLDHGQHELSVHTKQKMSQSSYGFCKKVNATAVQVCTVRLHQSYLSAECEVTFL